MTIALNILFAPHNTKEIRIVYKSKYNRKRENQLILLMITDNKKWHYLALKNQRTFEGEKWRNRPVTSLPKLLRGMTLNYNADFYCLNCIHSYSTENRLKEYEEPCNEHDHCYPEMPNKYNNTLEYNNGQKSLKTLFAIELDIVYTKKKSIHVKIILRNLRQREKLSINLQAGKILRNIHLTRQKINSIITEE